MLMSNCKIDRLILSTVCQRLNMINIGSLDIKINFFSTNKTFMVLNVP